MRRAGIIAAVFLVAVLCSPARTAPAQQSDTVASEANTLFDSLCLAYLGHGHEMLDQAYAIGASAIPQMFAQQFLGNHRGVALAIQGSGSLYMLGLTEQPSCLIAAPEANAAAVMKAFGEGARRLPVTYGEVNGQHQQIYAVIRQDAVSGQQKRMVVVATMSPHQGTKGVILNALPAKTAADIGIVPEKWPE
jgi:hypothetical protein